MNYRDIMDENYQELNNVTLLLTNVVNSYRLLISSAAELNNINISKKSDIKDALERVSELGLVIDELIKTIRKSEYGYCKYCETKHKYIESQCDKNQIFTEIDNALNFNNSQINKPK